MTSHTDTRLLSPADAAAAAAILRAGGAVALPTETVYGLAADATNAEAVAKIFAAKGRPSQNPLIVHVADADRAAGFAEMPSGWVADCIAAFWPGPLSLVLPLRGGLAPAVTAGLNTVAVRVPSHPTFRAVLREAALPLAAPSANRSGRPSGTTWQAVYEDLEGRIDAVVCDEPSRWGLESTVIDATGDRPIILRPGAVTLEDLRRVVPSAIGPSADAERNARSPGTRFRHYQPHAQVILIDRIDEVDPRPAQSAYIGLASLAQPEPDGFVAARVCADVVDYSRSLYDFFRAADAAGASIIFCQRVADTGLGLALMDRLSRAAAEDRPRDAGG